MSGEPPAMEEIDVYTSNYSPFWRECFSLVPTQIPMYRSIKRGGLIPIHLSSADILLQLS